MRSKCKYECIQLNVVLKNKKPNTFHLNEWMILFLNKQQMFASEVWFRVAATLQNESIEMISKKFGNKYLRIS